MNTSWLKIAGIVVLAVLAVVAANHFRSAKTQPSQQKTFDDVIREDDERLRAEPKPEKQTAQQPSQIKQAPESEEPKFEELTLQEQVEAERLFEMALAQRKMGRLPGVSYKLMVDYCRQIIQKYPDSVYAYKAQRLLRDIPEQYREQYNITDEELGT